MVSLIKSKRMLNNSSFNGDETSDCRQALYANRGQVDNNCHRRHVIGGNGEEHKSRLRILSAKTERYDQRERVGPESMTSRLSELSISVFSL